MLFFYSAAIFYYKTSLGILFLVCVALFLVATRMVGKRIILSLAERIKNLSDAQTYLVESLKNINTFKTFVAETPMRWKWENKFTSAGLHSLRINHLSNILGVLTDVLFKGVPFVVLIYGASLVLAKQMTVGQVIALLSFNVIIGRLPEKLLGFFHHNPTLVGFWFHTHLVSQKNVPVH